MKTNVYSFTDEECIEIIKNGDVLAFPTETVFGFGIVYDSLDAFNKLCALKQRKPDKPFTIMLSNKEDIHRFVNVDNKMQRIIDKFMPGEVTFLFPIKEGLYPWLSLNNSTVGIRISSSKEVRDLIKKVGKPMLVTSANISNQLALLNHIDVLNSFEGKIKGVVEGKCETNLASTIVLIDKNELKLIRQGNVLLEDILKEWKI